jgi:hypothetical protein
VSGALLVRFDAFEAVHREFEHVPFGVARALFGVGPVVGPPPGRF